MPGCFPRSRSLELFLLLTYGGWTVGWLLSLAAERSESRHYLRLRQWVLFGVVAVLVGIGLFGDAARIGRGRNTYSTLFFP